MSNPSAPSHLTLIQASRALGRAKSTVHGWMKPGGPLEAETHFGVRMVATYKVMAQLEKMRPNEQHAPAAPAIEAQAGEEEEGWDQ